MSTTDHNATKIEKDKSIADKALGDANAAILHRMFHEKCADTDTIMGVMGIMLDAGKGNPLPSDRAVEAMRDVALAAMSLAQSVVAANQLAPQGNTTYQT